MRIAVFGLGYVGCVTAACLAQRGHDVVGVDTNPDKVDLVRAGRTPVLEPGLARLVEEQSAAGRLTATLSAEDAVRSSDLSLVCVGTPSASNGSPSLDAVERVATAIGEALPTHPGWHTIVVRSTVLPGTTERIVLPALERASGRTAGDGFGLAVNPEFLREGVALADFDDPPKTVIGELDPPSGEQVADLYVGLQAPMFRLPLRAAEMVKFVDNSFHALKIAFANEIGSFCRVADVDSQQVMEVFRADRRLNISEAYLRPGFAFGGSCLPKDLRALVHASRRADLELPLLESVLPSNARHLKRAADAVLALGRRRIGLLGLAFKPGTDDLRESPLVELAETLVGKGYDLRIFDPAVSVSRLVGTNREYMLEHLPHLSDLLVGELDEVLAHAEVCIVGAASSESIQSLVDSAHLHVVDLVGLPDAARLRSEGRYVGVAW